MGSSFILQRILHFFCEWGASLGVIFWIAQSWKSAPPSLPVRMANHPRRVLLAFTLGVAPAVIGMLLWWPLVQLYRSPSGSSVAMAVSYILSVIHGVLFGLAASCCAGPARAEGRFRSGVAVAIGTALAVGPFALSSMPFQPMVYMAGDLILAAVILSIARSCMSGEAGFPQDPIEPPPRRSLTLPLLVAFTPSALLLAALGVAAALNLPKDQSDTLLWLCSVVSIFCCFGASIALFTRKTGGAIAGGIIFMLLNGFIAAFFGCCASFN
jgi:hypothetical protein